MFVKYLLLFLGVFGVCCFGQDEEITEACIRCLCHARTGCFRLKNCANYSINVEYWNTAGRPTLLHNTATDADAYRNCINDDGCILRTVTGYINALGQPDCNCNERITCKDFLATHIHGNSCNKDIPAPYLRRFDKCTRDRSIPNTPGWSYSASCNTEAAPIPV